MSGRKDEIGWLDPRLRAELEAALPEPPVDEVDWEGLRARIARGAEPRLARLRLGGRARAAWWEYAARWAAPVLPAAVAVAAALALLLGRLDNSTPTATATVASATRSETQQSVIEAAVSGSSSTVLVATTDQDALLRAAVNGQ